MNLMFGHQNFFFFTGAGTIPVFSNYVGDHQSPSSPNWKLQFTLRNQFCYSESLILQLSLWFYLLKLIVVTSASSQAISHLILDVL